MENTPESTVVSNTNTNTTWPRWLFPAAFAAVFILLGSLTFWYVSAATTTYSLWPSSAVPKTLSDSDAQSVELGVKFQANVSGDVTGVKFYKSAQNSGRHSGSLWDSKGNRLASVTFTGETSSGWQTATFPQPVSIAANVPYTISYHAPAGHYSANNYYFSTRTRTSGPLSAPKSTSAAPNGVYAYSGSAVYPTQTYQAANYWVDVLFSAKVVNPTPKPAPPTGISVTQSGTSLIVNWNAASSANPISKYLVLRNGSQVASVSSTTLSYTDTSATAGQTYAYQIQTVDNASLTSVASTTATATYNVVPVPAPTPAPVPAPVSNPGPTTTGFCSTFPALPASKPTATNTGVPAGTVLTNSGAITVTTAGTVIDGQNVTGGINVNANNVTIKNSKINVTGYYGIQVADNVTGTKVINSEIYTTGGGYIGIAAGNTTVCGSYIHGFENGMTVGGGMMIQANYIDKLVSNQSGPHYDGIEIYGGGSPTQLWGNNIMMTDGSGGWLGETGAINLTAYQGNIDNVEMNGNWLGGGSYTLYVDEQNGSNATNVKITNNIWYGSPPNGHAQYGPALIRDQTSVTTWSGNAWENGTAIAK